MVTGEWSAAKCLSGPPKNDSYTSRIKSILNQAWSPGYLSIFLNGPFPLWPVSLPRPNS